MNSDDVRPKMHRGKHKTADIGMKTVRVTLLRKHLATLEIKCFDGRIPLTLRVVLHSVTTA